MTAASGDDGESMVVTAVEAAVDSTLVGAAATAIVEGAAFVPGASVIAGAFVLWLAVSTLRTSGSKRGGNCTALMASRGGLKRNGPGPRTARYPRGWGDAKVTPAASETISRNPAKQQNRGVFTIWSYIDNFGVGLSRNGPENDGSGLSFLRERR